MNIRSFTLSGNRRSGGGSLLLPALVIAVTGSSAFAMKVTMVAELRGSQEVPPVGTEASGAARFVVDTAANTVEYHIAYGSLTGSETAAHIHGPASPGTNAGVKHPLPAGNPKTGVWNYAEADEADILAGKMYVNVHSSTFPGGEIRGQIGDFVATLDGAQAVPPSGSSGGGWATFQIDTCANVLSYYIFVEGLDGVETVAHIHGFSLHGAGAGVLHPLPPGAVKIGAWTYDEAQEGRILAGQTYVNIHSTVNPGGEIRGQIVNIVAPIDGGQEVPPVATPGHGAGFFAIDMPGDMSSYHIRRFDLSAAETAAHIHGFAPPGSGAGVLHPLPAGNPKLGTWSYPAADEGSIRAGLTYVNIHTSAHPGGEIRGQVLFPSLPCEGDVNCDGDVDILDLLAVLAAWGPCPPGICPTDVNHDGTTDILDLLAVLAAWGPCP